MFEPATEPSPERDRRRHPIRWTALAVFVVVALLVGFVFGGRLADGPVPLRSALIGQPAPRFDLPGLRGGRIRSENYAGQVYVVNFWASWCVPCRAEAPLLEAFANRWRGRVTVIGIDWSDTTRAAKDFVNEFHITYPQAVDADSRVSIRYGLTGVPETYVITADGVVAGGVIGAIGPHTLDDLLNEVAAGRQVLEGGDGHRNGR